MHEGFQVVTLEECVGEVDIFTSATGNFKIITLSLHHLSQPLCKCQLVHIHSGSVFRSLVQACSCSYSRGAHEEDENNAIVCNIGHFDNEIAMEDLETCPGIKVENIKPQVDRFVFPDGHGVIVLASGRLVTLVVPPATLPS